jgi:hypothetical protein
LDELPQFLNVLAGHMSLVGPRPKMLEHEVFDLPCRPGITGMATIVFACEEEILARVPDDQLEAFYHGVVLPAKCKLDADYMSTATWFSDLRLLVNSVVRKWDVDALENFIDVSGFDMEPEKRSAKSAGASLKVLRRQISNKLNRPDAAEEVSSL